MKSFAHASKSADPVAAGTASLSPAAPSRPRRSTSTPPTRPRSTASCSTSAPSKAEAIVAYRKANGAFKSAEQLALVKGIGLKTVEKNRDRIVVAAVRRRPRSRRKPRRAGRSRADRAAKR